MRNVKLKSYPLIRGGDGWTVVSTLRASRRLAHVRLYSHEEIKTYSDQITAGMGVPAEFIYFGQARSLALIQPSPRFVRGKRR